MMLGLLQSRAQAHMKAVGRADGNLLYMRTGLLGSGDGLLSASPPTKLIPITVDFLQCTDL